MGRISKLGSIFGVALFATFSGISPVWSATDQELLLDQTAKTVEHMTGEMEFGPARDLLSRARAVLIVPSLVKGGFIFGAEGGNGVLLARTGGHWSPPAFFVVGSASFGLQAGLEHAEIVMLIMSDRSLRAIQDGSLKFGAGAGITVVNLSGGAEAATPVNLAGDIIIWTSGMGLYGGLTLNGSVIKPREEWNEKFYGRPILVPEILARKVSNPLADPLQRELMNLERVSIDD